jgi:uncharacterized protein (DUF608 family)
MNIGKTYHQKRVLRLLNGCLIATQFCSILSYGQTGNRYNSNYTGANTGHIVFPIGGMGAGMFCLEGSGAVSEVSLHHQPNLNYEPQLFAALYCKSVNRAKVLEGPVSNWKKFGQPEASKGAEGKTYGLSRFRDASFSARFPFGEVRLKDALMSVTCSLTGWSPFVPTDADNSSLPVGALEYHFKNTAKAVQQYVFSYNAENCMAQNDSNRIVPAEHGFILEQDGTKEKPEMQGTLAITTDQANTIVDHCWFRGGWWDPLTMAWKKVSQGNITSVAPVKNGAPGASLYVPFTLKSGESKTIHVLFRWYVPYSHLRYGVRSDRSSDTTGKSRDKEQPSPYYTPWYASKFKNINQVIAYWKNNYDQLKHNTLLFTDAFYKSTLPPEVLDAVGANLTILKSPTSMRQYDGRFWGWEGIDDTQGSCAGNCTHVYNYAQALCHLFPSLERTVRETELNEGMDALGHQNYRMALPIRPEGHRLFMPAADGQLGSIMRAFRDWRISGDDHWLKQLYPKLKISMDYCTKTWDQEHTGTLVEPHHNTYDIEFWGADGYGTSYYLGALEAFIQMSQYLKTGEDITQYQTLFNKGKKAMENQLYNGEYFIQNIQWKGLHNDPLIYHNTAEGPAQPLSTEAKALLDKEGPKYQYGKGCLSDGVIGTWLAKVCGLPDFIDCHEVKSHLNAVYKYNFKTDLTDFSNPQRSTFALGKEGGLLLCTWPKGNALSLPFPYSNEVWTGIEYEVASHLIFEGKVKEGLNIVKTTRKRYNGTIRNPFDEYECGHWYARALSSYALLEALTGVRYDAVTKTLFVNSKVGDFTSFLSTNTGFGDVSYKNGRATLKVAYGKIDVQQVKISR